MYSDQSVTCGDIEQSEAMRLHHMCQEMTRSAPYQQVYVAYMEGVKITADKVEAAMKTVMLNRAFGGETMVACNKPEENYDSHLSQIKILDPKVSQTKGRKKDAKGKEKVQASDRIKSSIELSNKKKKRRCRCMKMKRHEKIQEI